MKAVLITGAGTRIGRHLAFSLAEKGWAVAIHYNRSEKNAETLVNQIKDNGGKAVAVDANLNLPNEVNALISKAANSLGMPLIALINNASTFKPDSLKTFRAPLFDHHIDINLKAPLALSRDFAKQMPKNEKGCIINMLDQRVLKPNPLFFTYSLSKAALYWTTKTMAQALAPNVRVNGIGPGPTLQNTTQTKADFIAEERATLLGHGSSQEAIFEAVLYLLEAKSVTGQMLAIDSGQHLNWKTEDLMIGNIDGT